MTSSAVLAAGKPGGGGSGGGKPGSRSGQILPINLGTPVGCGSTEGLALNSAPAASVQVVGYAVCAGNFAPTLWSAPTGMINLGSLPGLNGGVAQGVSDDGTVVGSAGAGGIDGAFYVPATAPLQLLRLPRLAGMIYAQASGINANGAYIVGQNSTDTEFRVVLWRRINGDWTAEDLGAGGSDVSVSNLGGVVGNSGPAGAWFWDGAGRVSLGTDAVAQDIDAAGAVIVGHRWQACPAPCNRYQVPVLWKRQGTAWQRADLPALDGVDSEAHGVAEVNGKLVVVGHGFTKKDGVQRAVAWIPDGSGNYGAPTRLAALNGRSKAWAVAADVNRNGQVVGTSAGDGLEYWAVLWTLPQ
jgi:uncharacterized membrane protein